jgi:hypothetical protein
VEPLERTGYSREPVTQPVEVPASVTRRYATGYRNWLRRVTGWPCLVTLPLVAQHSQPDWLGRMLGGRIATTGDSWTSGDIGDIGVGRMRERESK